MKHRKHEVTNMDLHFNGMGSHSRLFESLSSMLSRLALNPADISIVSKIRAVCSITCTRVHVLCSILWCAFSMIFHVHACIPSTCIVLNQPCARLPYIAAIRLLVCSYTNTTQRRTQHRQCSSYRCLNCWVIYITAMLVAVVLVCVLFV